MIPEGFVMTAPRVASKVQNWPDGEQTEAVSLSYYRRLQARERPYCLFDHYPTRIVPQRPSKSRTVI